MQTDVRQRQDTNQCIDIVLVLLDSSHAPQDKTSQQQGPGSKIKISYYMKGSRHHITSIQVQIHSKHVHIVYTLAVIQCCMQISHSHQGKRHNFEKQEKN